MHVDIFTADAFADGPPHHIFDELRAHSPVHWIEEPPQIRTGFTCPPQVVSGPGYWAVTTYEGVTHVSRHPELFSSWLRSTEIPDPLNETDLEMIRLMLLNLDPPQHSKLRRILQPTFTPASIRRLEPAAMECARQAVKRIVDRDEFDFVEEVAAEVPVTVLADLLGMPRADRHLLAGWSDQIVAVTDPEVTGEGQQKTVAAFAEMYACAHELATDRRRRPGDDLISLIVNAEVDGERLSEFEFDMLWVLMVVAGNETTRNLLSGGLLSLIEHPAESRRLRDDRALLAPAVEEMLRYVSPVNHFRRTATTDTELLGQPVRAGEKVVMYYVSANRDERVFPDPHGFDVGRQPNPHLAFGTGPHLCLGAALGRLEARAVFDELLNQAGPLHLTGPVHRMRSTFISGIRTMPVAWEAGR